MRLEAHLMLWQNIDHYWQSVPNYFLTFSFNPAVTLSFYFIIMFKCQTDDWKMSCWKLRRWSLKFKQLSLIHVHCYWIKTARSCCSSLQFGNNVAIVALTYYLSVYFRTLTTVLAAEGLVKVLQPAFASYRVLFIRTTRIACYIRVHVCIRIIEIDTDMSPITVVNCLTLN